MKNSKIDRGNFIKSLVGVAAAIPFVLLIAGAVKNKPKESTIYIQVGKSGFKPSKVEGGGKTWNLPEDSGKTGPIQGSSGRITPTQTRAVPSIVGGKKQLSK